jgi:hypothetical protein
MLQSEKNLSNGLFSFHNLQNTKAAAAAAHNQQLQAQHEAPQHSIQTIQ